jgi:4-hydroxy-4-methyl-2-oxoglutarate aldolase
MNLHQLLLRLVFALSSAALWGQSAPPKDFPADQARLGVDLITQPNQSAEDPRPLLRKFDTLRVSDVIDALQSLGLQDKATMDHSIRPLWRDDSPKSAHRFCGVALTLRFVPTNRSGTPAPAATYEEFKQWHSQWYRTYAPERPFLPLIQPGHAIVIDAQGIETTGFIGSNNSLAWRVNGAVGVVTNGGCRDTDELIIQKTPIYSRYQGGGTRPGRIELAAINKPVVVGGVLVRSGDVIVADGDGVVVVPRERAEEVAARGQEIAAKDKGQRRAHYLKLGLPLDETVK